MYYMLIGVLVVTIVGTIVSILTGGIKNMDTMDTKLLVPLVKGLIDRRQRKYREKNRESRLEAAKMLGAVNGDVPEKEKSGKVDDEIK
jgi:hypothetical protein